MTQPFAPVPLSKAFRLINHGPAVLVSARHQGVSNVMAAAWACALDYAPPKLTVVLDKAARTRELIEKSGHFVIQIPTAAQIELTYEVAGYELPFVRGCSAWMACRLVPEPHNQQTYDLFIGEVVGAWADTRVFRDGHWYFETADPSLRSLHYVAGGHFYAIGEALDVAEGKAG